MRTLIVGLIGLLSTAALANPVNLPIEYCYGDGLNSGGFYIDNTGINATDGSCVAQSLQKGPVFRVLCFSPTNETGTWTTVTLKEDLKAGSLTYINGYGLRSTLPRCP